LLKQFSVYSLGGETLLPLRKPFDKGQFSLFCNGAEIKRTLSKHISVLVVDCRFMLGVHCLFKALFIELVPRLCVASIQLKQSIAPVDSSIFIGDCGLVCSDHDHLFYSNFIYVSSGETFGYESAYPRMVDLFAGENGWYYYSLFFGLTEKSIDLLKLLYQYRQEAPESAALLTAPAGGGAGAASAAP